MRLAKLQLIESREEAGAEQQHHVRLFLEGGRLDAQLLQVGGLLQEPAQASQVAILVVVMQHEPGHDRGDGLAHALGQQQQCLHLAPPRHAEVQQVRAHHLRQRLEGGRRRRSDRSKGSALLRCFLLLPSPSPAADAEGLPAAAGMMTIAMKPKRKQGERLGVRPVGWW